MPQKKRRPPALLCFAAFFMKTIYQLAFACLLLRGLTSCSSDSVTSTELTRKPAPQVDAPNATAQAPAKAETPAANGAAGVSAPTRKTGQPVATPSEVKANRTVPGTMQPKAWRAIDPKAMGYAKVTSPSVREENSGTTSSPTRIGAGGAAPTAPTVLNSGAV